MWFSYITQAKVPFSQISAYERNLKRDMDFIQQFNKQEVNTEWVTFLDTILSMKIFLIKARAEHLCISGQHCGVSFLNESVFD